MPDPVSSIFHALFTRVQVLEGGTIRRNLRHPEVNDLSKVTELRKWQDWIPGAWLPNPYHRCSNCYLLLPTPWVICTKLFFPSRHHSRARSLWVGDHPRSCLAGMYVHWGWDETFNSWRTNVFGFVKSWLNL